VYCVLNRSILALVLAVLSLINVGIDSDVDNDNAKE
jgi:hypothetical protein